MNRKILTHDEALERFSGVSRYRLLGMCLVLQENIPCEEKINVYSSEELILWIDRNYLWNHGQWVPKKNAA